MPQGAPRTPWLTNVTPWPTRMKGMPAVKEEGATEGTADTCKSSIFHLPVRSGALGRHMGRAWRKYLCGSVSRWTHFLPCILSPMPELVAGQSSYWHFLLDCWMAMFRALGGILESTFSCVIFFYPLPSPLQGCYLHSKTESEFQKVR